LGLNSLRRIFYNHTTPSGLIFLHYLFYNHITPLGLILYLTGSQAGKSVFHPFFHPRCDKIAG
jgi:hypothetical protein